MNYVKQQHSNGCMVACAAMIIGTDYWTAMTDALGGKPMERFDGWSTFEFDHMLAEHGFAVARVYQYSRQQEQQKDGCSTNRIRSPWPLVPWAPLMHVMVKVFESANVEHSIVIENGVVFDPLFPERKTMDGYFRVSSMAAVTRVPLPKAMKFNDIKGPTPESNAAAILEAAMDYKPNITEALARGTPVRARSAVLGALDYEIAD